MTAAFIILAHTDLAEAGALAHTLAAGGRAVAVHIDARAPADQVAAFDEATKGDALFRLPRRRCDWGMFSLVEATLAGVECLMESAHPFTHIALVSGACLPLRPLADFDAFLEDHADADLIEAVELSEKRWVMDGLSDERFRLYHPFNWRKRRRLFDLNVAVQRIFRVRRSLPPKLTPALGSQWWCLSRATLSAILADPQLPALKRFFRSTWIPDESFFQTLARRWGQNRINQSQTFSRFDEKGIPYVFHDDHAQILGLSDHFFTRKIHPRATRLRNACLKRASGPVQSDKFEARGPDEEIIRARRSRTHGREHVISPARIRKLKGKQTHSSAWPYLVIGGVGDKTAQRISDELSKRGEITCHGRIFGPAGVSLRGGAALAAGCLPASHEARDFWPEQYVINLARGGAAEGAGATAFCLSPEDRTAIGDYIASDSGARILWWRGAWALDLYAHANLLDGYELAERAQEASAAERGLLATFRRKGADVEIRSAALLIDDPAKATLAMLNAGNARASTRELPPPSFAPKGWEKARPYLRALQKSGVEVEIGLLAKEPAA